MQKVLIVKLSSMGDLVQALPALGDAINPGKIMAELGYRPEETFEAGLRTTIQWYLNNEDWWR